MTETNGSVPRPLTRRPFAGLLVGLVALAVLGFPIVVTALLATWSFSGCFLECSTRQPGRGIAWSVVTALLLALPVYLGLSVARVRSRRARLTAGAAIVVVVVGWAVLSLVA